METENEVEAILARRRWSLWIVLLLISAVLFPPSGFAASPIIRSPLPTDQNLLGVGYGNGLFVAVGANGTILTSADGATWTSRPSGTAEALYDAAYANGTYVVVGQSGTILTSSDGTTWTQRTTNTLAMISGVAYGNGRFVAVADSGGILTSPDGVTWTNQVSGTTEQLVDVAYGNGTFVAAGANGANLTSSDGVTWADHSSGTTYATGVTFGNGLFAKVTIQGYTAVSSDGVSWTEVTSASSFLYSVAYTSGQFVAVGKSGTLMTYSSGASWTTRTSGTANALNAATYGNGTYVAVGDGGTVLTSTDGAAWMTRTSGTPQGLLGVVYANGTYVAVGAVGTTVTSTDAANWTSRTWSGVRVQFNGVAYGNGTYVAVGHAGTILTSSNGVDWTSQTSGTSTPLRGVTYANGTFVVVGDSGEILTSPDGSTWTSQTSGTSDQFGGVASGNNKFVAVGAGKVRTSSDGVTWTVTLTDSNVYRIGFADGKFVAVGFSGRFWTSSDGETWTERNTGASHDLYGVAYGNGVYLMVGENGTLLTSLNGVDWGSHASGTSARLLGAAYGDHTFVVVGDNGTILQYSDASLSGLTLSSGTLSPAFAPTRTSYTVGVANAVSSMTVTPTLSDNGASVTVNGQPAVSGSPSGAISLSEGSNTVTVEVRSHDGITTQRYTITVTRAAPASNNANLSGLWLSSGSLDPAFEAETTSYTVDVANNLTSVRLYPVVADSNATVTVNGESVARGSESGEIGLTVGSNLIPVVVTAADGTTTRTYRITVTRAALPSSNADLSGLALSGGGLVPAFSADTTSYTADVENSVSSLTITPTAAGVGATINVYGEAVASGSESEAISLNVGENAIWVMVTAQDHTTTKTYMITVTRAAAASSNADLSGLALSSGSLVPAFEAATTSYTASVANSVSSLTVTPTVADSGATVKVNGEPVTSGSASGAISLNVGNNTVTVLVTAPDGTTTKTYAATVNRAAPAPSIPQDPPTPPSDPAPVDPPTPPADPAPVNPPTSPSDPAPADPPSTPSDSGQGEEAGLPILLNGRSENQIATGSTSEEGGQTVLTVTVDPAKLASLLAAADGKPLVTIPVVAGTDKVTAVLTGDAVKAMESKQAVLDVQTPNGSYRLPAAQLDIEQVMSQLGDLARPSEILFQVNIEKGDSPTVTLAESAADRGNFTIVVPPVEFTVTASHNGKTVEVHKFNAYVEREIPLPDGVDPAKVTTATVLEADGTVRHVPTRIVERGGKYYAVVSSLTNSAYAVISHTMTFEDVEGHWSKGAVSDMASRLIVRGVDGTHFDPDVAITRAQFAAIIVRALGLADNGSTAAFSDVNPGDWYMGAVAKAQEYGLITGYQDGTFRPGQTITRQEAMVILARAMKLTGLETSVTSAEANDILAPFADGSAVAQWASQAVAATVKSRLVVGSGNNLRPSANITRAETASIIQRMLIAAKLI